MSEILRKALQPRLRRLRSYPKYKSSGAAWLGAIPCHWDTKRLKYVAPVSDERTYDSDPNVLYVGLEHIESGTGRLLNRDDCGSAESTAAVFRAGDVLFGKLRPYLAKVLRPSFGGTCTTELLVLRGTEEIDSAYLSLQLLNPSFIHWINSMTYGAKMPRANPDQIANSLAVIPPVEEQRVIASFLNREIGKIDVLVTKKEELINLLQEKRTALITRAVTKGYEGLSRAPEKAISWTSGSLGRFIRLQRGFDITGAAHNQEGYPVFSSGGLSGFTDKAIAPGPGVIVGRKGTLGTVHYSESDYWPHDTTLWVMDKGGNFARFIYYFLIHMRLEDFDVGAANPTLNRNHVHPEPVLWPDREAQKVIATYLDKELANNSSLIETIREGIRCLTELRTSLISAAVTGKIDVREEVP